MSSNRLFAGIVAVLVGASSAHAAPPLKQGEGARLIKKAYPSIVKVRNAYVFGGQVLGVDAKGNISLFNVDAQTKKVTRLSKNLNAKILDKVGANQGLNAKVAIGDAVGKADVLTRTGRVRVGVSFDKKSPNVNFNKLVAVGQDPTGKDVMWKGNDAADTNVAAGKAMRALNKRLGYWAHNKKLNVTTLAVNKKTLVVGAAATNWGTTNKVEGRIMSVDRKTGKIKELSGNLAKEALKELAKFEQRRGHVLASHEITFPSVRHQSLGIKVKWVNPDAQGNQGRERFYDMYWGKLKDSSRDQLATDL